MTVSMPRSAFTEDAHIQWNHVDGPLLTWAGQLHWLTWRERIAIRFGRATANSLAHKHWRRMQGKLVGWFLPYNRLNEPMIDGFERLHRAATRARYTNATVRKDGVETVHQADWIKLMVKLGLPDPVEPPIFKFNHSEYGFSGAYMGPHSLITALGEAVKAMSEDGWLCHSTEGMSEAQTTTFKAYELYAAYLAERDVQEAEWRAQASFAEHAEPPKIAPPPPVLTVADNEFPPMPEIDPSSAIGYEAIRYVSGYTESYVKDYAMRYAKLTLSKLGYALEIK